MKNALLWGSHRRSENKELPLSETSVVTWRSLWRLPPPHRDGSSGDRPRHVRRITGAQQKYRPPSPTSAASDSGEAAGPPCPACAAGAENRRHRAAHAPGGVGDAHRRTSKGTNSSAFWCRGTALASQTIVTPVRNPVFLIPLFLMYIPSFRFYTLLYCSYYVGNAPVTALHNTFPGCLLL